LNVINPFKTSIMLLQSGIYSDKMHVNLIEMGIVLFQPTIYPDKMPVNLLKLWFECFLIKFL